MQKFFFGLIGHKKLVLVFYLAVIVLCGFLSTKVKVNSDLADYLPSDSDSTIALSEMKEEFTGDIPNASMMVTDISMSDADKLQKKIKNTDGVIDVSGIADENPLSLPYEFLGEDAVDTYYRDGHALYTLTLDTDKKIDLLDDLRALTDKKVNWYGYGYCPVKGCYHKSYLRIYTSSVPYSFIREPDDEAKA